MSAKRKPRFPVPVRPKSNGDDGKYSDYVSRAKIKAEVVGSEDRHNPLVSVIQAQMGGGRQPQDFFNPPNIIDIFDFNPGIKTTPLGTKYCINCGDFVKKDRFSPDKRSRDGLHSWCKACRNEQARRIYWHEKHTAIGVAA